MKTDEPNYVEKLQERVILSNENSDKKDGEKDSEVQDSEAVESASASTGANKVTLKYQMKGHFDSINDCHYVPNMEVVATVSEDC